VNSPTPNAARVVVLATGGTIAGTASHAADSLGYRSAQLGVHDLVAAVPALAGQPLECEQLAQLDSNDIGPAVWQLLARRVHAHLARPDVAGVVVTHGTDTLEETAWFLHRVLAPHKPVVLTAAMRPATSLQADGPQNLLDAVTLARAEGARGVLVVLAGQVHGAADVRKAHTHRLQAFSSGEAGPLAAIEAGVLRRWRDWPNGHALGLARIEPEAAAWPWVEVLTGVAGAQPRAVQALVDAGVAGVVWACAGNGGMPLAVKPALAAAQAAGVAVRRASRCGDGAVLDAANAAEPSPWPAYGALGAVKSRVELLLELLELLAASNPGNPSTR
jgi:L-asparaginase